MEELRGERISQRALARALGVFPMAVTRAIRNGRLRACVAKDADGIAYITDLELAKREWEANVDRLLEVAADAKAIADSG